MSSLTRTSGFRGLAVAIAFGFALGACGDDGGASSTPVDPPGDVTDDTGGGTTDDTGGGTTGDTTPDDGTGTEGSASDEDLVVPRAYLQGEWCDSEGDNWSIEGDTATLDDGSGGTAEFPIGILFIDGVDVDLISQTDDQFVFGSEFEQVTFTRGSC